MTTQKTIPTNTKEIKQDNKFKEFCILRNLSKGTINGYATILLRYIKCHNMTFQDLIQEAEDEEETIPRLSKRHIKQRLIDYKIYMQENNYSNQTINDSLTKIKTLYSHFDIVTPKIPKNKPKKYNYTEIITKEDIQQVLEHCNLKMKAVILFMCSSGTAIKEVSTLTIQDFIDSLSEYHDNEQIFLLVRELLKKDNLVPTFHITRQKTDTPYFTFCSPEATHYILLYLHHRLMNKGISSLDERLFDVGTDALTTNFRRLNDKCEFGWMRDTHRYFHSHALRKFFATSLLGAGVSELTIDFLEGRSISGVHGAYFKPSPKQLRQVYINALEYITILSEFRFNTINSDEKIELERYRIREKEMFKQIEHLEQIVNKYFDIEEL